MKTQHDILMEDPEFRKLLAMEALAAEASEAISRLMAEQNVSKADLARKLNKSRAWVTQLLSGKANLTVRTLAEVVHALDSEVKLNAQAPGWRLRAKAPVVKSQSVIYRMEQPITAETLFRLHTHELLPVGDEDLSQPKYAA